VPHAGQNLESGLSITAEHLRQTVVIELAGYGTELLYTLASSAIE
jgi:hypothetical protein